MTKYYTATKSRSQGREGWAVIFRHPVRVDTSGKTGRRVRRGLGTSDESTANHLVAELNEVLQRPELWEPAARVGLATRFDERVLDIFFDGIEPSAHEPEALRDEVLPLPGLEEDYRSALMLGTTGAGKTTLVRQLLGTDPDVERFPSTSTAKTTVADTELIFSSDPMFRAVVTFVGRDEVIDYLTECVCEAALAMLRNAPDLELRRRLLDHPNQRFRFSYILGRGTATVADDDDDEVEDSDDEASASELIDLAATEEVVSAALTALRSLVADYDERLKELATEDGDERLLEELREVWLDSELRADDRFHAVVDTLFDEIEKRFDLLVAGSVSRNRQGWPVRWSWETESRIDLVKAVTRFSSNYAPLFGSLLTPLVNGIRVAGAFEPKWPGAEQPRLVLIDGEGLGHAPNSAAALSTAVSKRIEVVDAVVLVDNAAQPMQAAPVAAMKAVVTSGNASKLLFVFTHFDVVKGDNLPTVADRQTHVKASVDNVLKSVGEDLGPFAERILHQRIERACFFVGGIDEKLDAAKKADRRTIEQMKSLLAVIDHIADERESTDTRPVYDRINLVLAVREAATAFHERWSGLLGITYVAGHPKEHWTRIKALSRRFAEGWSEDFYDTLRPVGELKRELDSQIYRMLQQPVRWEGPAPTDDDKQSMIDALAKEISKEITTLTSRRIKTDRKPAWQEAYAEHGTNSTFRRARIISSDIYNRAAPVPTVTPSPDQNSFLHEVTALVDAVAANLDVNLL